MYQGPSWLLIATISTALLYLWLGGAVLDYLAYASHKSKPLNHIRKHINYTAPATMVPVKRGVKPPITVPECCFFDLLLPIACITHS